MATNLIRTRIPTARTTPRISQYKNRARGMQWWIYASILSFLVPKIAIAGTYVGLLDGISLAAVLVIPFQKKRLRMSSQNRLDIAYAGLLVVFSLFWAIAESDLKSMLIGVRTLAIALAAIFAVSSCAPGEIRRIVRNTTVFIGGAYLYPACKTIIRLLTGSLSTTEFLWDYTAGRLTAPFETSSITSVPIGYLFSLCFIAALLLMQTAPSKRSRVFWQVVSLIYFLYSFLTASRAAVLSCLFAGICFYMFNSLRGSGKGRWIGAIILACLAIYPTKIAVEKTLVNGFLDSSTGQRLLYYQNGLRLTSEEVRGLLFGYGVSDDLLLRKTGTAFYESMLVNSQMQGGLALLFAAVAVLIWPMLRYVRKSRKYARAGLALGLSITVLIANTIGGSNYFSMFSYVYYCFVSALIFDVGEEVVTYGISMPRDV